MGEERAIEGPHVHSRYRFSAGGANLLLGDHGAKLLPVNGLPVFGVSSYLQKRPGTRGGSGVTTTLAVARIYRLNGSMSPEDWWWKNQYRGMSGDGPNEMTSLRERGHGNRGLICVALRARRMAPRLIWFHLVRVVWIRRRYLVAECWFGPAISVLQRSLPPRVRWGAEQTPIMAWRLNRK